MSWLDTSRLYDISSDGKILFAELSYGNGGNPAIYLRKTNGSPAVRLGDGARPSLSPDSRWVVCIRTEENRQELILLPTGAGELLRLTTKGMSYEHAEWFPDSKRILFTGAMPNRPIRTYAQVLDGSPPLPVTAEGVKASRVTPDQKFAVVTTSRQFRARASCGGNFGRWIQLASI